MPSNDPRFGTQKGAARPRLCALPTVVLLLALIWSIQLANALSGYSLNSFGIAPRQLGGLLAIPVAPLLHGSWTHLLGNSLPLLMLGGLINLKGQRCFIEVSILVALLAGLGTWLFGSYGLHLGASGLVLGYWGYLIGAAFFLHDLKSLLLALVAVFLYGGLLFTLTDLRAHISWPGHLFGLLAGVAVAKWHAIRLRSQTHQPQH